MKGIETREKAKTNRILITKNKCLLTLVCTGYWLDQLILHGGEGGKNVPLLNFWTGNLVNAKLGMQVVVHQFF